MKLILILITFIAAHAYAQSCPVGPRDIERYPYPDEYGDHASVSTDEKYMVNANTFFQVCAQGNICPAGIIMGPAADIEPFVNDPTCSTYVNAKGREISIDAFDFKQTTKSCKLHRVILEFNACEKIYWSTCSKEAAGHDCKDGEFVGSRVNEGVFPSHRLTIYSFKYNYNLDIQYNSGGGSSISGCELIGADWTCS